MKHPRVFVPQEPTRWDPTVKTAVPIYDLSPASKFGAVQICLPPTVSFNFISPVRASLEERMKEMEPGDYLMALGAPRIIAISSIIAHRLTGGRFYLLEWDKRQGAYWPTDMTDARLRA